MARVHLLIAAVGVACSGEVSHFQIQVASANAGEGEVPTVVMTAGETRVIQFMAIGSVPASITFSATGLPSYASLSGSLLTLSPVRADAGEVVIDVSATAGSESSTTSLRVVVNRPNQPPRLWVFNMGDDMPFIDGDQGPHNESICPGGYCTLFGTPRLWLGLQDPDGDAIKVEVEVVVRGQAFTGHATHTAIKPSDWQSTVSWNNYLFEVPLTGLTADQSYQFAIRISDEYGAVMPPFTASASNGWSSNGGNFAFDLGPCVTRQCACAPSGIGCEGNPECCSGICDPTGDVRIPGKCR